jgi:hypothetical protein
MNDYSLLGASSLPSSVYITNNPLHVLYSIALIKKETFGEEYLIIWCGALSLDNYFPETSSIFDYSILDLSHLELNYYFPLQKNYKIFLSEVANHVQKVDYLVTCFDTHLAFEALRNHYCVHWAQVVILEDGIGNYFRSTMPLLRRQIPKSILNFFRRGYLLNMTRSNLGGNPKVGFISALAPDIVYKHRKSKARVVPIKNEFRAALEELRVEIPEIYYEADVLISLTPIFSQNRMSESELVAYINKILAHPSINEGSRVIIKPHPREDLETLVRVVFSNFGNTIAVADQGSIEMYLPALQNMIWAGLPSSGFLNSFWLYGPSNKYMVFPLFHMPFSFDVLQTLKKLMGPALDVQSR